jgi:hypothetical protein
MDDKKDDFKDVELGQDNPGLNLESEDQIKVNNDDHLVKTKAEELDFAAAAATTTTTTTTHHAEVLVNPKVRAIKKVTDFGYPRAKGFFK